MKHLVLAFTVLAACATSSPSDRSVSSPSSPQPDIAPVASATTPCAMEIALECPSGSVDGCLSGQTTAHVCVASSARPGPSCAQEVALECPANEVDACSIRASANHVCVRR